MKLKLTLFNMINMYIDNIFRVQNFIQDYLLNLFCLASNT